MCRIFLSTAFLFLIGTSLCCQSGDVDLSSLLNKLEDLEAQTKVVLENIETIKLKNTKSKILEYGLPSEHYQEHLAYYFEYSEKHEQAAWVSHMITVDVEQLGAARTNDFREDPLVLTGTATEVDYFLTSVNDAGETIYDGFGYDRGHLAPSADFRWSSRALSESYYYSNMSPMRPEFNREIWADLEAFLRGYVIKNQRNLIVITGPVLEENLISIDRSVNKVSIPRLFYKIAYDPFKNASIAFLIPNKGSKEPLESFAFTVDDIELRTNYNFLPKIDELVESKIDKALWFDDEVLGNAEPIPFSEIGSGRYNTTVGGQKVGSSKDITVCGTVVASRKSRSGNVWLNLDKKYPNDYFSIMIKKDVLHNFSQDPLTAYTNEKVCFDGSVFAIGDKPTMSIKNPEDIRLFN